QRHRVRARPAPGDCGLTRRGESTSPRRRGRESPSLGRESFGLASVMRRGDQYVESLRDGRVVYLDGERVVDVTKHPAFAEPIKRIADRYDAAGAEAAQSVT